LALLPHVAMLHQRRERFTHYEVLAGDAGA